MKRLISLLSVCLLVMIAQPLWAQTSQRSNTNIHGNTEINVTTRNMTAVAAGEGNVAKNRVGVVQGNQQGNTRVNVVAGNVTTIAIGRNKKACTNIGGVVSNECK